MPIAASRIEVTDAPTQIGAGRTAKEWVFDNRGEAAMFVGGADVTADTGFQVDAGSSVSFILEREDEAFAVCATGTTTTLHALRQ